MCLSFLFHFLFFFFDDWPICTLTLTALCPSPFFFFSLFGFFFST